VKGEIRNKIMSVGNSGHSDCFLFRPSLYLRFHITQVPLSRGISFYVYKKDTPNKIMLVGNSGHSDAILFISSLYSRFRITQVPLSRGISFCKPEIHHYHYAVSVYHSNELSRVNT
jgi:phosphoheptose isomerase